MVCRNESEYAVKGMWLCAHMGYEDHPSGDERERNKHLAFSIALHILSLRVCRAMRYGYILRFGM